ncbi:MAG: hypothetical protein HY814_12945 [Candidatus Riflebacteria bacterium]|nr:hypothetical protein [Candidatus Riflebacteria bacterium]
MSLTADPGGPSTGRSRRLWVFRLLLAASSFAFSIALFEGLSFYLMLSGLGPDSPKPLLAYYRGYYWYSPFRHVIQFDPACSVYDDELFYRLKPGNCTHTGLRFSNAYSVNSLGVRDDEESLTSPGVICLGDSHTMGWGVDQQDTFTQLIERKTGLRALNMGVSSYGTVRELLLLKRADLSGLKVLVIQYDDNDLMENTRYLSNGRVLYVRPREFWNQMAEREKRNRYFPGRHFFELLRSPFRGPSDTAPNPTKRAGAHDAAAHARAFLAVVASFDRPELRKARLVVFDVRNEIHQDEPSEKSFSSALAALKPSGSVGGLAGRLTVLELARKLNGAAYRQVIDNHLNEAGHRLVADAIVEEMARGQ